MNLNPFPEFVWRSHIDIDPLYQTFQHKMFSPISNQEPGLADRSQIDLGEEFSQPATTAEVGPLNTIFVDGKLAPLAMLATSPTTIVQRKFPAETNSFIHRFSLALVIIGLLMTAAWICLLGYALVAVVRYTF